MRSRPVCSANVCIVKKLGPGASQLPRVGRVGEGTHITLPQRCTGRRPLVAQDQENRRMATTATSSSKNDMITILSKSGMVEWLANTARLPSQIGAENQRARIRAGSLKQIATLRLHRVALLKP